MGTEMKTTIIILLVALSLPQLCCSKKYIYIPTYGNNERETPPHGFDVHDVTWMLFEVKGCNDGYIYLYSQVDFKTDFADVSAFIVLGGWGNKKCFIQQCNKCKKTHSQEYPYLNCSEFRPMWVDWADGMLSIGEGLYVGEKTFMTTAQQGGYDIEYLGVGSGWNQRFVWRFDGPAGELFDRMVPPGFSTRARLSSLTSASLTGCIRECRQTRGCKSISYSKSDGACALSGELTQASDVQDDSTWDTWTEKQRSSHWW